jgi:hypothetical protein
LSVVVLGAPTGAVSVNASSMSDGGVGVDGSRLQKRQRAAYLKLVAAIQLRRGSANREPRNAATSEPVALGADAEIMTGGRTGSDGSHAGGAETEDNL